MRSRLYRLLSRGFLPAATLFAWLCVGCRNTSAPVATYVHPLTGLRTDLLGDNLIESHDQAPEMVWLNAYRVFKTKYEFTYYLEVIYGANEQVGYLEIGPGRALTLTCDGEELSFNGLGSLSNDRDGKAIFEHARYEVTAGDLEKIAGAKMVSLKLRGRNGVVRRELSPDNIAKFRDFMAQSGGAM
jgi:hypothetical protein